MVATLVAFLVFDDITTFSIVGQFTACDTVIDIRSAAVGEINWYLINGYPTEFMAAIAGRKHLIFCVDKDLEIMLSSKWDFHWRCCSDICRLQRQQYVEMLLPCSWLYFKVLFSLFIWLFQLAISIGLFSRATCVCLGKYRDISYSKSS